jgi:hypothetical protein
LDFVGFLVLPIISACISHVKWLYLSVLSI